MRIGRTLPPAAAPIGFKEIVSGLKGIVAKQKELNRLKKEIKLYYGCKHCFLVSSGKAALTLILRALHKNNPEKKKVLIPAFTCFSVPSAIVRAGLTVSLCDVDKKTLDFNFDHLKKHKNHLENNLLAIMPTDLFGLPADIDQLKKSTNFSSVSIIEDAAQAMGACCNGKKLGNRGDVGFFSLGRGKALSSIEGGIIITNDDTLANHLKPLYDQLPSYSAIEIFTLLAYAIILTFFTLPQFFWIPKALPFLKLGETHFEPDFKIKKMSPFQAGLLRNFPKKLETLSASRVKNLTIVSNVIRSIQKLKDKVGFVTPNKTSEKDFDTPLSLIRYPLFINDYALKKQIMQTSEFKGLGIMASYPDSINHIPSLKNQFNKEQFENAQECAQSLITFPIHPLVAKIDVEKLKNFLR